MGVSSGFGPPAATWDNVWCWSALMRVLLEPWEARMLVRLSVLRANILSEKKPGHGG